MIIGITGSIATGKSTVSKYIQKKSFTVIDADKIARHLLHVGSPFLLKVAVQFGKDILTQSGELNREKLANIIFNDETKRQQLDEIMHPAILRVMQLQTKLAIQNGEEIIFWDVPLLFEAKFHQYVDKTMVVYTAPQEQLIRLMNRQHISQQQAQSMMDSQWSIVEKVKLADIIIDNTGSLSQTYQQIDQCLANVK